MLTNEDMKNMGEQEVRNSLARGDYIDPSEISLIESWLRVKDDERAFEAACERAARSAALDAKEMALRAEERAIRAEQRAVRAERLAERAAKTATIAASTAVIAAIVSIITLIDSIFM